MSEQSKVVERAVAPTVTVLCANDYPHSVFEDQAEAERVRDELTKQEQEREDRRNAQRDWSGGGRMYYHTHEVPLVRLAAPGDTT